MTSDHGTAPIVAAAHDSYVKNLLERYYRADVATLASGRTWYAVGRELARMLGSGDVQRGAGIIAALSPRIHWSTNVRDARTVASDAATPLAAFPKNVAKARRIAAGEDWRTVLTPGTKTWHFAAALAGDDDAATIDAWMIGAALGLDGAYSAKLTPRQYDVLAAALRDAAATVGETPAAFQAIVWIVQRGRAD